MKRVTILISILVVSTSHTGCCRGLRCWGMRGAPCQTPVASPYAVPATTAPVYSCPPVACPPVTCPPVSCPPVTCPPVTCQPTECVPTTVCQPDPCLSYDYGSSTTVQPTPTPTQPAPTTLDGVYLPNGTTTSGLVDFGRPTSDQLVGPLQPIPVSPAR